MSNNIEQRIAKLEALLFVHGEPLTLKKIAMILGANKEEVEETIGEFKKSLEEKTRGIILVSNGEKIQLATKPEFGKILEDFVKDELSEDLTPATLETLAIIAYFGPISRARIEYSRGVNSIFILRSLLLRGLIERFPDPERQNSYLYKLTFEAWRHLGLKENNELPEFDKFQSLIKAFESQENVPDSK